MPTIFISYRRDDSKFATTAIYEKLCEPFGQDQIFMDVDTLLKGRDFREELTKAVQRCDLVLAIIGDKWVHAEDHRGKRLDNPSDFVRLELEAALSRDIPLIPLLVDDASMPEADQLPKSLEELAFRNAAVIRSGRDFVKDLDNLVADIQKTVGEELIAAPVPSASASAQPGAQKKGKGPLIAIAALALAAAAGALLMFGGKGDGRGDSTENPGNQGPSVPSGPAATIPLRITGLVIEPTPEKIEILQSNGAHVTPKGGLPGHAKGDYELPVASNFKTEYNWPLEVLVHLAGYEAPESIQLPGESLMVYEASASFPVDKTHRLIPTRSLQINAQFGEIAVPLTPVEISIEGGEKGVTQPDSESPVLKFQASAEQVYPLTVTVHVPGFKKETITLTASEPAGPVSVELTRLSGFVSFTASGAGVVDFENLELVPNLEGLENSCQRDLLKGSLAPIPTSVKEPAQNVPAGSYQVRVADGLFKGGSLGTLTVGSGPTPFELPPSLAGVYVRRDGLFTSFDKDSQKFIATDCDVVVLLTPDNLGPRFIAFVRLQGTRVASLGAPLDLIQYDSSTGNWKFEVNWDKAKKLHDGISNRDESYADNITQMNPATLTIEQTASRIECEFIEAGNKESKSKWSCEKLAPNLEEALKELSSKPLFSSVQDNKVIPPAELSMERWLGAAH